MTAAGSDDNVTGPPCSEAGSQGYTQGSFESSFGTDAFFNAMHSKKFQVPMVPNSADLTYCRWAAEHVTRSRFLAAEAYSSNLKTVSVD